MPGASLSDRVTEPRGKVLPLNSKRLRTVQLQRLARALSIPTSASGDELRQLIDGKLEGMEREPRNVQVVISEAEHGPARLSLKERGLKRILEEEKRKLEESASPARVSELESELKREKMKSMWRMQCEQMVQCDNEIAEREAEIVELRAKLLECESHGSSEMEEGVASAEEHKFLRSPGRVVHRGKAPPVDAFTGEEAELRLEDWLPTLESAASWNGWTQEELLMQFAGYLRGRALQEWNLLGPEDRETYETATQALRTRLDPGGRALAAQDFCHTVQRESEAVGDFVRRLERTFQIAYGRDPMSAKTRNTLLHSQLQEGLRYEILKAPAVYQAHSPIRSCASPRRMRRDRQNFGKEHSIRVNHQRSHLDCPAPRHLPR